MRDIPVLRITFPGGRYHATPWGNHVNEGVIEWPPSPWRLLRALVSVGYTTGLWTGGELPPTARSLFERLASVLPRYRVPPATGAHSRHFMPLARLKENREDTTLVFDTWAHVDDGELTVVWDVALSDDEQDLMSVLAARLGYLGRSESWASAQLANLAEASDADADCYPCDAPPPIGVEQIALLSPLSASAYSSWRASELARLTERHPAVSGRAKRSKAAPLDTPYPADLIDCLQVSTSWLRGHGWSQPPGTRRVHYWRASRALSVGIAQPRRSEPVALPVEAMLLALRAPGGNPHVLPSVARTLPQAEHMHRALVSRIAGMGTHSRALSGCDEQGTPLQGPHEHAHILPMDLDRDGHIDHVLVWAPMGLGANDQAAVRAVRETYAKGVKGSLSVAVVGAGSLQDLSPLVDQHPGFGTERGPRGCVWRSDTPFVPPRHVKARGRNSLAGQINAELTSRGLPPAADIRVIDPHEDDRARANRHVVRQRRHGPRPPVDVAYTLEMRFDEPVTGPICLGYASHFGLGRFAPRAG